jgi:uncharacterized membrane protein YjjP (DUF1212 family)
MREPDALAEIQMDACGHLVAVSADFERIAAPAVSPSPSPTLPGGSHTFQRHERCRQPRGARRSLSLDTTLDDGSLASAFTKAPTPVSVAAVLEGVAHARQRPHHRLQRHLSAAPNSFSTFETAFSSAHDSNSPALGSLPSTFALNVASEQSVTPADNQAECCIEFLICLAQAAFVFGEPTHRLQFNILVAARVLNIDVSITTFPTYIMLTFGPTPGQVTLVHHKIHIFSGVATLDCHKLYSVDSLILRMSRMEISFQDAEFELDAIIAQPPLYAWWARVIAMAVSSAALTLLFFAGSWRDAGASFLLGIIVGFLDLVADRFPAFARIGTFLSATIAASLSMLLASYSGSTFCFGGIVFAAIVWLLPGLTLTVAVLELSTKANIVSGTSRFFGAIITSMQLGFGISIGTRFGSWVLSFASAAQAAFTVINTACNPQMQVERGWIPFLFVLMIVSWNILMNAARSQWLGMLVISGLGFGVYSLCASLNAGSDLATVFSALSIGIAANVWARFTHHPSIVLIISGILLLVPGGLSVKSVHAILASDAGAGFTFAVQMVVISLSITVGVSLANLIALPREDLQHQRL